METLNNNKLIAEFMGFEKCIVYNEKGRQYDFDIPNPFTLIKLTETSIESEWCEILLECDYCFIEDLKFHTSWDWLMPVVEKIEQFFNVSIVGDSCTIESVSDKICEEMFVCDADSKIEAVYGAVVSFINWFNSTKVTSPKAVTDIIDDVIFSPAEQITNTPKEYPFE